MNPITTFSEWLGEATAHPDIKEPTAMTLATVAADGRPSARIVLLKEHDADGFVFFTNYESRKSHELEGGNAALCFYWMPLDKQVRVEGTVEKISAEESDAYFATRGREKQIGAWASVQSEAMGTRDALEVRITEFTQKFAEQKTIPRPPHWGGWRVVPDTVELWQQRDYRLHERNIYTKAPDGSWHHRLLFP